MRIPEKILIGAHDFRVDLIEDDTRFNKMGEICCANNVISLKNIGISESAQAETLLHEIIEAIDYSNELRLDHHKICTLSEQIFAVIRNNNLDFTGKTI